MDILFVDDEPNILDGLRRMLFPLRKEWSMHFASSGEEALAVLERTPCDVVVTDMRMPGMTGDRLLEQVRDRHPGVIRVVLSGQAHQDIALRAINAAHQYLHKPCDADGLRASVARALSLHATLTNETVRNLVNTVSVLPSPPQTYLKLRSMLEAESATPQQIGELIGQDPAMTSKILQLVNSAFFGFRREVTHPSEAVRLLGFDLIQALTLTAGAFTQVDDRIRPLTERLWLHNMRVVSCARAIAHHEGVGGSALDTVVTGSLLHDIGKLVLASEPAFAYFEVVDRARREKVPVNLVEEDVYGTTHGPIGAYLLDLWTLPHAIVEPVAYHHTPDAVPPAGLSPLLVVHVSDSLAHVIAEDGDDEETPGVGQLNMSYLEACGVEARYSDWERACRELIADAGRPSVPA